MAATTPDQKAVLTGLVRVATPPYESAPKYIRCIGRWCHTGVTRRSCQPVAIAMRLPRPRRFRPRSMSSGGPQLQSLPSTVARAGSHPNRGRDASAEAFVRGGGADLGAGSVRCPGTLGQRTTCSGLRQCRG